MMQLGRRLVGFFFLLMLVIPTTLQVERAMLLFILCMGSIQILIKSPGKWSISTALLYWLLACVTYSIFSITWGLLNGAQGAIPVSTVYVVWPILYVYFIGFGKTIESYVGLIKILLTGIFLAALSGILLVASSFYSILSIFDPYFKLMSGSLGLYENSIAFTLSNMAVVIYGLPFLIGFLMLGGRTSYRFSREWKIFCIVSLLASFFVMFISGRKAFVVVGLIAMPLNLMFMRIAGVANLKMKSGAKIIGISLIFVAIAALIASMTLALNFSELYYDFISGFDFNNSDNISAWRRAEQFRALMSEWKNSPVIGFGQGSSAHSAPGDVMPWAYELQYVALLFQTGILGVLVYGSAVGWLMYQMMKLSRKYVDLAILMIPALTGLVCFLIANATNPYLNKFDYLWTLFLPVGLVNIGLLRDSSAKCAGRRRASIYVR